MLQVFFLFGWLLSSVFHNGGGVDAFVAVPSVVGRTAAAIIEERSASSFVVTLDLFRSRRKNNKVNIDGNNGDDDHNDEEDDSATNMNSTTTTMATATATKPKMKKSKKKNPHNVFVVQSHADWLELIEGHNNNNNNNANHKLTAVTFTAAWCKFCQKFQMKWNRNVVRANINNNNNNNNIISFGTVEFGANKKLCKSLDIHALPTIQIYNHHGKLINSFPCGPKGFSTAKELVQTYMEMSTTQLEKEAERWPKRQKARIIMDQQQKTAMLKEEEEEEEEKAKQKRMALVENSRSKRREAAAAGVAEKTKTTESATEEEDAVATHGDNNNDNNNDNDEEFEPSLYLRRRDRIKRKLRGGRYREKKNDKKKEQ